MSSFLSSWNKTEKRKSLGGPIGVPLVVCLASAEGWVCLIAYAIIFESFHVQVLF